MCKRHKCTNSSIATILMIVASWIFLRCPSPSHFYWQASSVDLNSGNIKVETLMGDRVLKSKIISTNFSRMVKGMDLVQDPANWQLIAEYFYLSGERVDYSAGEVVSRCEKMFAEIDSSDEDRESRREAARVFLNLLKEDQDGKGAGEQGKEQGKRNTTK